MKTLTKDDIRQLTPEQQESIAFMETQRIRLREEILKRVRHRPSTDYIGGGIFITVLSLAQFSNIYPRLLPFAVIVTVALILFHANRSNRRLDALLELLDHDGKYAMRKVQADNDRAA